MTIQYENNTGIEFLSFGIDLGTTNSCIVKLEGKELRVYPTKENINTTRSAVYINKHGKKYVGLKAYNAIKDDVNNVALEFKRLMGTSDKIHFPATNINLSPVELSAEVLKSLKSDVKRLSAEDITQAVIAVPAAFGTLQCEATYQSAVLAGFDQVYLLQEPIAAAIAYGASTKLKNKNWLVYDFGGGTFDVAVVTSLNNRLTVLNNEGNNLLGGKDIDRLIVDNFILPKIEDNYRLFNKDTEEYREIYNKLILVAEEAKVELSNLEETLIYIDSNEVGCDEIGDDIDLEITITRDILDEVISTVISQTMELSRKALEGAGINQKELEKIVLVGGSTQIPLIKRKLSDYFMADIALAKDPITIVAKGAAIYASTIEESHVEQSIPTNSTSNKLGIKLEYGKVTSADNILIQGRLLGREDIHEVLVEYKDGFWSSGWCTLTDYENNYFEINVRLKKNCLNEFVLKARDKLGNEKQIESPYFSIKHEDSYLAVSKPLITSSLCVEYSDNNGINRLKPVIQKNTVLPAYEEYTFRSRVELRTSRPNDFIAIKLWEGETFEEPEANQWVANLYIRATDIKRVLPRGSEITVSINVDESRRIMISASSPGFGINIAEDVFYKPTPLSIDERFKEVLGELDVYDKRLDIIGESIDRSDEDNKRRYENLRESIEDFEIRYHEYSDAAKHDKDKALKIIEESKLKRRELLKLEKDLNIARDNLSLEKEAFDTLNRVDYLVDNFGNDEDKEDLNKLKNEIQEAIEFKDQRGVKHYVRTVIDKEKQIISGSFEFWAQMFQYFLNEENEYVNKDEAQKWIEQGENAISNRDLQLLSESVYNLSLLVEKDLEQVIKESIIDPGLLK